MAHDHHSAEYNINRKFKIGIVLNLSFVAVELAFGIANNSLALISDAGHNFSDVISLMIAWGAGYLGHKKPTAEFTYGFKKSTIIAAQLNSLILLVAIGVIVWEAVNRLGETPEIKGEIMMIVAGIGVIINGITAFLFLSGKERDMNIKGAYLHMLADTMISIGVVISGLAIYFTDLFWIDPVISILITILIFWGTYKLFRDSTKLSLDAVPDNVNIEEVKKFFAADPHINEFHDLHIWALSTTENALTVHLTVDRKDQGDEMLYSLNQKLKEKFGISHSTIQIEEGRCENGC